MITAVLALALLQAPAASVQPSDPQWEACKAPLNQRFSGPSSRAQAIEIGLKACTALIEEGPNRLALIEAAPNRPLQLSQVYLVRAELYKFGQDCTRAVADFQRVIDLNDKETAFLAYGNRAVCYRRMGRLDDAIADDSMLISLVADKSGAWFRYQLRGDDYLAQGRYDAAIADYTQEIQLSSEAEGGIPYRRRAHALHLEREDTKALADANKAISLDSLPNKSEGQLALDFIARAQIYEELHRLDRAILDYRAALEHDPRSADAQEGLRRLGAKP